MINEHKVAVLMGGFSSERDISLNQVRQFGKRYKERISMPYYLIQNLDHLHNLSMKRSQEFLSPFMGPLGRMVMYKEF